MKKPIDIEKLVQWAMLEELPKGNPVAAYAIGFDRAIGYRMAA